MRRLFFALSAAILLSAANQAFADDNVEQTRCHMEIEYKSMVAFSGAKDDSLEEALEDVKKKNCKTVCRLLEGKHCKKACMADAKVLAKRCVGPNKDILEEGTFTDRKLMRQKMKSQQEAMKDELKSIKESKEDEIVCRLEISYRGETVVAKDDGDTLAEALEEAKEEGCKRACSKSGGLYGCKKSCMKDSEVVATECKSKSEILVSEGEFSKSSAKKAKAQKEKGKNPLVQKIGAEGGSYNCTFTLKYDGQSQRLRYKTDSIEEAINKSKEDACDKLCNDQDACKKTCIPKIELMNTLCR